MTQPKKPISRSSTPIEFTPLVLDLDPEIEDGPKKRRGAGVFFSAIVGVVVLLGVLGWSALSKTEAKNHSNTMVSGDSLVGASRIPSITTEDSVESGKKKAIFLGGPTNAKLILENVGGEDVLRVAVSDKVEEDISWKYDWTNNNQPIGQGDSVKGFKRGDNVAVRITPFDGENYGKAKVLTTEIKNTIPQIIGEKAAVTSDGKQLTYRIEVADADGDNLTYSLVEGPPNVAIDPKSGIISWPIVSENQQKLDLKVKISDGHNGEIVYPLTVNSVEIAGEKLTARK